MYAIRPVTRRLWAVVPHDIILQQFPGGLYSIHSKFFEIVKRELVYQSFQFLQIYQLTHHRISNSVASFLVSNGAFSCVPGEPELLNHKVKDFIQGLISV